MPCFLVGLRGVGKSTTGRLLAKRLGQPFLDADDQTAEALLALGYSGHLATDYERLGEGRFRGLEAEVLERVLPKASGVVACPGGLACHQRWQDDLPRMGWVLALEMPWQAWLHHLLRVGRSANPGQNFDAQAARRYYEHRLWGYRRMAHAVIDVEGLSVCDQVERCLLAVESLNHGQ